MWLQILIKILPSLTSIAFGLFFDPKLISSEYWDILSRVVMCDSELGRVVCHLYIAEDWVCPDHFTWWQLYTCWNRLERDLATLSLCKWGTSSGGCSVLWLFVGSLSPGITWFILVCYSEPQPRESKVRQWCFWLRLIVSMWISLVSVFCMFEGRREDFVFEWCDVYFSPGVVLLVHNSSFTSQEGTGFIYKTWMVILLGCPELLIS